MGEEPTKIVDRVEDLNKINHEVQLETDELINVMAPSMNDDNL